MFTSFDKAIVGVILAAAALASTFWGAQVTVYATQLTTLLVALIPVAVYFVPNFAVLEDGGKFQPLEDAVAGVASEIK